MRRYIEIVENAQVPGRALFDRYGGKVYEFHNLPQPGKNSVVAYYEEEHGFDVPPDSKWGYVEIPMEALKQAIGGGQETPFTNFDDYHAWYVGQGDMPNHTGPDYAVILDWLDPAVLYDGWHRFHHYVRSGVEVVPAVLPLEHLNQPEG
jgi:hypothetical protein